MPKDWIDKRKSDPYYKKAKSDNFSSRAAFKLLEMKNFGLFSRKVKFIIDLCAHPGSWIEVLLREISNLEVIIGIDIQNLKRKYGPKVKFIKADISTTHINRGVTTGPPCAGYIDSDLHA